MNSSTAASYAGRDALASGVYGRSPRSPECITTAIWVKVPTGYARTGRVLHRVRDPKACVVWSSALPRPRVVLRWWCGAECSDALFGAPEQELTLCVGCDFSGVNNDGRVVYFAECDGLIKIGTSINAMQRVSALKARLLGVQAGGFAIEADLHQRFHAGRVYPRGEWFRPTPDLLDYIAGLSRAERVA